MIKNRLTRLENAAEKLGAGLCPLCHGTPMALVMIMTELDPGGPGFRDTGDAFLLDDPDSRRLTDDLRCCRCGTAAEQIHLMTPAELHSEPKGRRVCVTRTPAGDSAGESRRDGRRLEKQTNAAMPQKR